MQHSQICCIRGDGRPIAGAALRRDPRILAGTQPPARGRTHRYAAPRSGTGISGPSPDGAKGVTVLMFTEGRAFAELEFDGPPDSLVPPDFVTDVGQKQDAAIKRGLAG